MPELAYVQNRFVPLTEATVSVEDRGFQFGDGVYEVIVAYAGRPFRLSQHLARLRASMAAIHLDVGTKLERLEDLIREGIHRAGFTDTLVYIQITRGTAPRSHVPSSPLEPTLVLTFRPKSEVPTALLERGLSVCTTEEIRWARCHVKSVALLPTVVARLEAAQGGYDDAIFVTREGEVLEASAANVFVVKRGVLKTPPTSEHILHGITRAFVLECARALNIPCAEDRLFIADLRGADEVFLSSTSIDVLAVTRVDGIPIQRGRPGPITCALNQEFRRHIRCGEHQNSVTSLA